VRRRIPPVEFSLGKPPQELLRFAPRTSSEWTAAAAREAGRAIGTTPDAATGMSRATRAAQLAVEDQSVAAPTCAWPTPPQESTAPNSGGFTPTLAPGEESSVCVTVTVRIPFLPEFVDANTATGQFVVERDRYVDA
jgi:hypothetical protein